MGSGMGLKTQRQGGGCAPPTLSPCTVLPQHWVTPYRGAGWWEAMHANPEPPLSYTGTEHQEMHETLQH